VADALRSFTYRTNFFSSGVFNQMTIEIHSLPRCSVCRNLATTTRGMFMFKVQGREFAFRDYEAEFIADWDEAACSFACLDRAAAAHAESLRNDLAQPERVSS